MFGQGSRSVVLGGKLESRWTTEVVRYENVSSESLMDFMTVAEGAQCGDLLEFKSHMVLARHGSMERFRIHQRRISHVEPLVRGNVELMA